MDSSKTAVLLLSPSRSWLFALLALLSARHWGKLLHSLAAALEHHWPKLVDKAVFLEHNYRRWRIGAAHAMGVVSTSLVSLVAAGNTATASAKTFPEWKAVFCKEMAVLLYSWCVSTRFLATLLHFFQVVSLRSHLAAKAGPRA